MSTTTAPVARPTSPSTAARPRRVGVVGGVGRASTALTRVAAARGVALECHDGHTAGRGAPALAGLVGRCELVVIVTDVNSHNGAIAARRASAAAGRAVVQVRRLGARRLAALLDALPTAA